MTKKHVPVSDELITMLEKGITDVINDKEATVKDKMSAIAAGVKVAAIKHRLANPDEKGGFFD